MHLITDAQQLEDGSFYPDKWTQQKLPVYDPSYTDSSLPASDIHPGFRYSFAMYGAIAASMADSFS